MEWATELYGLDCIGQLITIQTGLQYLAQQIVLFFIFLNKLFFEI